MTKKEMFVIARSFAKALVNKRASDEITYTLYLLAGDLAESNPKFDQHEFISLVQTAVPLMLQHGDAPGTLESITINGNRYP